MKKTKKLYEMLNRGYNLRTKTGRIYNRNITKADAIIADLEKNHNHSWYQELYNRNKNSLGDIALVYRGTTITYREMFSKMEEYAKSLKSMGIVKDSEIPVCISNCPELIYLMGAASMIGAKLNIFGPDFPNDYIRDIIKNSKSEIVFAEDSIYEKIKKPIDDCGISKIIMTSLTDSLKGGVNAYKSVDERYGVFDRKVDAFQKNNHRIMTQDQFISYGDNYSGELHDNITMDQDFVITYTSGSTNAKKPKAIVHSSRNFIVVARYHDKDINGITTKPFTSLAHIPTYSNTNLVSCISDSLMQGAKLALEPIYDKDHFIESILMYNPHYIAATKSFWVETAKKILYDSRYNNAKFGNLLLGFSCGEPLSCGEEKFINRSLRKAKAGTSVTHTPMSLIRLCEAAGDCEHGSIFYSLLRSYSNKKPSYVRRGEAVGLDKFDFVETAVLDETGNYLPYGKIGRLVANSPCTMKRYNNDDEATKAFFITDATGKQWADMNVYGYIDSSKKIHIKGRIPKHKEDVPLFLFSDAILLDKKNILSCEVIKDDVNNCYIAHVEMMPNITIDVDDVLFSAYERCQDLLELTGIPMYFRVRDFNESFPLTKSGKRDIKSLKSEGLSNWCIDLSQKTRLEDRNHVLRK